MNHTLKALIIGGMMSGCAANHLAPANAPKAQVEPITARQSVTNACAQAKRYQECIVEGISTSCKESSGGVNDAFYACTAEGLRFPERGEANAVELSVSAGDELLSLRNGNGVVVSIARLEASAIDDKGVKVAYEVEMIPVADTSKKEVKDQASVRYNYDGTTEGDVWKLRGIEIWNLKFESAGSGKAKVSFETREPGVVPGL